MPHVPRSYSRRRRGRRHGVPGGAGPLAGQPSADRARPGGAVLVRRGTRGQDGLGAARRRCRRRRSSAPRTKGFLRFQRADEYLPYEPGPRSRRTFAEFQRPQARGPNCFRRSTRCSASRRRILGTDPRRRRGAARTLPRCLVDGAGRGCAASRGQTDGTGGARPCSAVDLQAEQLAEPARERLFSGELKEFPDDVRVAFTKVAHLAPEMFTWLGSRYLEHRSVNGIVEDLERLLRHQGWWRRSSAAEPARDRLRGSLELHSPHARARRRIGGCRCDLLQRLADATATRHRGRLVKLLGDGVLLQLPHPAVGVEAALDLVEAMHGEGRSHRTPGFTRDP